MTLPRFNFRRVFLFGVCAPLLLLSLLLLGRTLSSGAPDLVLAGYAPRWWSLHVLNYWFYGTEIQVNDATRWPPLLGVSGPFVRAYHEFAITHEVGALADRPDHVETFDLGVFQSFCYYKAGALKSRDYKIVFPGLGPVVTILTALPFLILLNRRYRIRRRLARGLCGVCGYDLRATPARCPECGAVAPAQ